MTAKIFKFAAWRNVDPAILEASFSDIARSRGYDPARAREVAEIVVAALTRIFPRDEPAPEIASIVHELALRTGTEFTLAAIEIAWPRQA